MLKTIQCKYLPNGCLEEFNKCIYRKLVDREFWRRNILNTIIYLPNDGREFWRQNGITKHIQQVYVMNTENVQHAAGQRRGKTNIFTGRQPEFWRQNETDYQTQFIHRIKATCCTCKFFKKVKLHSPKRLMRISAFWKTHSRKLTLN